MEEDGRARLLPEARDAEHVIDVGVGEPDGDGLYARSREVVGDERGLLAGIDDGALAGRLVDHEVAVLDEAAVGDLDDLHEATVARSFSRSPARYFSTAIAAVVASPTAVVILRGGGLRLLPPAHSPPTEGPIPSPPPQNPPPPLFHAPTPIP